MYLIPDEVDIKDPPIIVKRMQKRDMSKLRKRANDEYVVMPDVDIDEVTARKTAAIPSFGIMKKQKSKVSVIMIIPKCKSS